AVLAASPAAGDLDVHRQPDAEHLRVAALAPGGLLGAQLLVPGRLEDAVERAPVVAGVVLGAGGGGERELVGRHEVRAADLGGVHADLGGEEVDRPLDGGRGLGPTRTAVGGGGGGVGDDRPRAELGVVEVVD